MEKGYRRFAANVLLSPGCFLRENYQINTLGEGKWVFYCSSVLDPLVTPLD